MSKIFIFADDPESDAIKNAVKVISAACDCTVYAEKTSPANILSIVVGLLSTQQTADSNVVSALPPEPAPELPPELPEPDDETESEVDLPDDIGDLDTESDEKDSKKKKDDEITFNFESLGYVDVDGERIKAYKTTGESELHVMNMGSEAKNKCSYKLNESTFAVWLNGGTPSTRVRINKYNVIDVHLKESKRGESYLLLNTSNFKK